MFARCCCCGVLLFLLRFILSSQQPSGPHSAAGVCTYLAACLCAGNDVFVLMRFPPSCSEPQFLLPFLLPLPSSLYISTIGWGCMGTVATHIGVFEKLQARELLSAVALQSWVNIFQQQNAVERFQPFEREWSTVCFRQPKPEFHLATLEPWLLLYSRCCDQTFTLEPWVSSDFHLGALGAVGAGTDFFSGTLLLGAVIGLPA